MWWKALLRIWLNWTSSGMRLKVVTLLCQWWSNPPGWDVFTDSFVTSNIRSHSSNSRHFQLCIFLNDNSKYKSISKPKTMPSYRKTYILAFGFLKISTLFNVWGFENYSLTCDFLCVFLQITLKQILTLMFLGRIKEQGLELILAPSGTAYTQPVTLNEHVLSCTYNWEVVTSSWQAMRGKRERAISEPVVTCWHLEKAAF